MQSFFSSSLFSKPTVDTFKPLIHIEAGDVFARSRGMFGGMSIRLLDKQNIVCLITAPNVTANETSNIANDEMTIAITKMNGVIFFNFRAGRKKWMDATLLSYVSKAELGMPADNEGFVLHMALADTNTGKVKAKRTFELSNEMSETLHDALINMDSLDEAEQMMRTMKVTRAYSPAELVQRAIISEKYS